MRNFVAYFFWVSIVWRMSISKQFQFSIPSEVEEKLGRCLQEYFIADPLLFERLSKNNSTLAIHIPCDNIVNDNDAELQQLTHYSYVGGATRQLHKAL